VVLGLDVCRFSLYNSVAGKRESAQAKHEGDAV
jgi:hypothetical protein